jgi:hypothetical protein
MSREDVIRSIVQREIQKKRLAEEAVQQDAPELYRTACELFGTWITALKYAGVNRQRLNAERYYSGEKVIQKIREMCRGGYRLRGKDAYHYDRRLHISACYHYGCWRIALQAAGVELQRANINAKARQLNKDEIIAALHQRHQTGHSMQWGRVCMEDRALATAAKHAFYGWRRALLAAGLTPDSQPNPICQKWNKDCVIERILQRHQEGKSIQAKIIWQDEPNLMRAAKRYFGSWRNALKAAGLKPPQNSSNR